MRAVLDVNVFVSALLAPAGAAAALLLRWLRGEFELVTSDELLAELSRALAYPKLQSRITDDEAGALMELLHRGATIVRPPDTRPARRSRDPGDEYLLILAAEANAFLVSWDRDLLDLDAHSIESPPAFLRRLTTQV